MKKNYKKLFAAVAVLAAGVSVAQAQAVWEQVTDQNFANTHRTTPTVADFDGDGRHDVFYAGQGNNDYWTVDPDWYWQIGSYMFYNTADGWVSDCNDRVTRLDSLGNPAYTVNYETDTLGNPVKDLEGNLIVIDITWHIDNVNPKTGILGTTNDQHIAFDYNNDGLVDMLVMGYSGEWDVMGYQRDNIYGNKYNIELYKNNGDGTFTLVPDAVFANIRQDNKYNIPLAVGDYNHDGYTDILINGALESKEADNYPGRACYLYRNEGGTGMFTLMNIAESRGGVWTGEVKDEEGNVITEAQSLDGVFMPISGNVHFADLNNDGWLDIVEVGWADNSWDGIHSSGNACRVYININGEKFVDQTPVSPGFYTLRSAGTTIADVNGDGFLDLFQAGWGDNGVAWNTYLFTGTGDTAAIFDDPLDNASLYLFGTENCKTYIRDYDGDGIADVYYCGPQDGNAQVWYLGADGTFAKGDSVLIESEGFAALGDFDNNGMTDIFHTGYSYQGGGSCAELFLNKTEAPAAPDAPENVAATWADGKLTITWEYDLELALKGGFVYNLYVKKADGSLYCVLPADPETGFVKVGEGQETAIRPQVKEYSLTMPEGNYTVGVQTLSMLNATYSAFTTATLGSSAIESVENDAEVVAVEYYNLQGQKLSVAPETGAYVVKEIKADGTTKARVDIK